MAGEDERLVVMLEARVTEFEKRMKRAEKTGSGSFRRLRGDSRTASRQMEQDMTRSASVINQALATTSGKVGEFGKAFAAGIAGGVIAGALAAVSSDIRATVKDIATMGDEARRSGLAAKDFQEWKFVAEQNRIGIDSLVDGFKELSLRADEYIVTGSGSAAEAFQRLGFSALDLKEKLKDPSALMLEIMRRLQGLDKAAQIRIADEVFGGTGGERFVELLAQGEGEIRKTMQRAHEVGAVMDDQMVVKAAELDRKFEELTTRVASFGKQLAVSIADVPFDIFETRINELFSNDGLARAILGDDYYEKMREAGALTDEQTASVKQLRNEYLGLQEDADSLAIELAGAASMADQLGNDALWQVLAQASQDMRAVSDEFSKGAITGEEFAGKMDEIRKRASDALGELQDVDAQGFSGVIANLGALGRVLDALVGRARALKDNLPGGKDFGMDTGTGLTVDDIDLPGSGVAPKTSPRPQSPGVDSYGDWEDARNGGKKSGGAPKNVYQDAVKGITEETAALQAEAAALLAATQARGEYGDAAEYARARAELLVAAQQQGVAVTPALEAQIDQLARAYSMAGKAADDAADRMQKVQDNAKAGAQAVGGIFMSIANGSMTAKEALAQLLLQIAQAQLMKGLAGMASSGAGGGIFGALGGLLSGARANGGPVSAGGAYLVGERGPEILQMGSQSGRVIPNHALAGMSPAMAPARPMPAAAANAAPQKVKLTVDVQEGPMFRSFVRSEARNEAAQVVQPAIAASARQWRKSYPDLRQEFERRGTTT